MTYEQRKEYLQPQILSLSDVVINYRIDHIADSSANPLIDFLEKDLQDKRDELKKLNSLPKSETRREQIAIEGHKYRFFLLILFVLLVLAWATMASIDECNALVNLFCFSNLVVLSWLLYLVYFYKPKDYGFSHEELRDLQSTRAAIANDIEKLQAILDEYNCTTIPGAAKNIYIQYVEKQLKDKTDELSCIDRKLNIN